MKLEVYEIDDLGLEVKNVIEVELNLRGFKNGVKVNCVFINDMVCYNFEGIIII